MTISIHADGKLLELRAFSFSGGERQVRVLEPPAHVDLVRFHASLWNPGAVFDLLLLVDAVTELWPRAELELTCPYLPYARQDRVCHPGEAFSLRVMARLINSCHFRRVTVWDVHNEAAARATILNLVNVSAADLIGRTLDPNVAKAQPGLCVVAPDHGAIQRASEVAERYRVPLVRAEKTRDPDDGSLRDPRLVDTVPAGVDAALVVDDLCDGGRTFVQLARVLREADLPRRYLYVTHGIFSAGFSDLAKWYDRIYVANLAENRDVSGLDYLLRHHRQGLVVR